MRQKKILFFIESFSGGGAERVLYTVVKHLDRERFDITILVMSDVGVQRGAFHQLGVKIINVLDSKSHTLNLVKSKLLYKFLPSNIALRWIMKGIKADTYIAFVEGYCTKIFSRLPKKAHKIAWVHCDLDKLPWTIKNGVFSSFRQEKRAYLKFNKVIGVSNIVTNVLKKKYGLSNVERIYNPIDECMIKQLAASKDNLTVSASNFNLVSVGRITKTKGYDKLIQLIPEIIKVNPNIKLYIIGMGEDRPALESEIKKLGIRDYVCFSGFMMNPYSALKDMDLFVCSSRSEGFSLAIAEAMTVGLPIVSMKCAGPSELLDNGKYGILASSYEDLRDAIIDVANNEARRETLRKQAIERSRFFDTKSIVRHIESIL